MSSNGRTRIALVGAGRMGQVHLRAIRASAELELAGVVEPVPSTRAALAADGVHAVETCDELLAGGEVDGVLIAAPSPEHPALARMFIAAGIPVLCEKPVGVRSTDVTEVSQSARDAGVLLQVGYWRRFVPALQELRARIRAGELGDIYQVSCYQWDQEPPSPAYREHSGGISIDMGVHEFDQIRWLVGQEISWLSAVPSGPDTEGPATDPDAALILLGLSGGAKATVSLGRRFPVEDSCWVEVWGTDGHEHVPFMWAQDSTQVFLAGMRAQVESFARAVHGAPVEGAAGPDAIAALTVAEMATASLQGDTHGPGTRVSA